MRSQVVVTLKSTHVLLFLCQVWCGLTNTGEMIAVKQVELNYSNVDEAEEVC